MNGQRFTGGYASVAGAPGHDSAQALKEALGQQKNYVGVLTPSPAMPVGDLPPLQQVLAGATLIMHRIRGHEQQLSAIASKIGGGLPGRDNVGQGRTHGMGGVIGETLDVGDSISQALDGIDDLLGYLGKLVD
jgi:hypothetical protein